MALNYTQSAAHKLRFLSYSMKILKYILSSAIIACSLNASANNNDWANIGRYAKDNAALPAPSKEEHRVVFLGNSITDFWSDHHPDFFSINNYINRGISGQTSSQFLLRFRQDVINLHPDIVVINAGTNDCAENDGPFNIYKTFGNIVSMVELAQANGINVILSSVLPADEFSWNKNIIDAPDRIAALNDKIKEYANKHKIPYADYYSAMVHGNNRALNPEYTNDGVHPNSTGYTIMEAIITPVIGKILTAP